MSVYVDNLSYDFKQEKRKSVFAAMETVNSSSNSHLS